MEDRCNRCGNLERMIEDIFKATGYMDVYQGNTALMCAAMAQGIAKDKKVLDLYRAAGQETIKELAVKLIPGATNGPFI